MKPCMMALPPETCRALTDTLARVGDKWSMLTIVSLEDGEMRFNGLRRRIDGISQKMLTVTVRGLERDGYVSRRVAPTKPPSVHYALTPLGREVLGPVRALAMWALSRMEVIQGARASYDARTGS